MPPRADTLQERPVFLRYQVEREIENMQLIRLDDMTDVFCKITMERADFRNTPALCAMMKFEVERARDWFRQGLPLVKKVNRDLAVDLELFTRGGQEILDAIERQGFAVLGRRPSISFK